MSESFEVHIAKAEHVFSAAHFITFADHCERLHGHNYHVSAEIAGPLDENHLVIDFLLVRAKLLEITTELDHYVLLPTQHPQIRVEDNGREVTATFDDRRWVFPRATAGCCRSPIRPPSCSPPTLASGCSTHWAGRRQDRANESSASTNATAKSAFGSGER